MKELKQIIAYLTMEYETYVDLCGKDDIINTLPCKKALKMAKKLKKKLRKAKKS